MYERVLTKIIERGQQRDAAVAILGPRQVDETTLALDVAFYWVQHHMIFCVN